MPTPVLSPDETLAPVAADIERSLANGPGNTGVGEVKVAGGDAIGSPARTARRLLYGEGGTVFKSGAIVVRTTTV